MKKIFAKVFLPLMVIGFFTQAEVNAQSRPRIIHMGVILSDHADLINDHSDMDFAALTTSATGLSGSMRSLVYNRRTSTLMFQPNSVTAIRNYNEAQTTRILGDLMIEFLNNHGTPQYRSAAGDYDMSVFREMPMIRQITAPTVGRNGTDGRWEMIFNAADGYTFFDGRTSYRFFIVMPTQK